MKTSSQLFIVFFAGIMLFVLACDKPFPEPPADFREQYVGNWYFTRLSAYRYSGDTTIYRDTSYYHGQVWYNDLNDSFGAYYIHMNYSPEDSLMFEISLDGQLYFHDVAPVNGQFESAEALSFSSYSSNSSITSSYYVSGDKE